MLSNVHMLINWYGNQVNIKSTLTTIQRRCIFIYYFFTYNIEFNNKPTMHLKSASNADSSAAQTHFKKVAHYLFYTAAMPPV